MLCHRPKVLSQPDIQGGILTGAFGIVSCKKTKRITFCALKADSSNALFVFSNYKKL